MSKCKVSVVMTVYNDSKYIKRSVHSIVSQTYKDFEFIIVDDGSTDDSMSIVESFNDKRIHIYKVPRMGRPSALNFGVVKSKGELVVIMDADDISLPSRIEKQVKYMDNNPHVDFVGGSAKIIDQSDRVIGLKSAVVGEANVAKLAPYGSPIIHPTSCYRRLVFNKIGGYREEFLYAQDYDLVLRVLDSRYVVNNMPDILIKYRINIEHVKDPIKLYRHLKLTIYARKFHKQRVELNNKDGYSNELLSALPRLGLIQKLVLTIQYKASVLKLTNKIWVIVYYLVSIFNKNLATVVFHDYIYHKILKNIKSQQ